MTMTPERAIEYLRELHDDADPEHARLCAEDIIIDLLNYFGADEVGREWAKVPAWTNCSWTKPAEQDTAVKTSI